MAQKLNTVYLLFGGNLDNVKQSFLQATQKIDENVGVVFIESGIYKSPAWGFESTNDFLNQVIGVRTAHPAIAVLKKILAVEKQLGRVRDTSIKGFSSRKIDIDILYFNDEIIDLPELTIPHNAISERKFTLLPLAEILPNFIHPVLNKTNQQLLHLTNDQSKVEKI